jgi:hypothetical protein
LHNSDKAIAEKDFFKNNKAAFDRWNIEWSDRTAALLKKGALLADSRISPKLPRNLPAFTKAFGSIAKANKVEASALFMLLHSTALKYTAGKYFRPGMVFALLY